MSTQPTKPPVLRVPRSKEQAQVSYDRLSKLYDLLAGSEHPYIDRGLKLLDLAPGESVLEIGCGTGHALLQMAQLVGETGLVCGLDISTGMLSVARCKLQDNGVSRGVLLVCADAVRPPIAPITFNAVFMSFTLELFDNPQIPLVIAACRRLLNASGRLCVVSLDKTPDPGLPERLYEWTHSQLPALLDCRPIYTQEALQAAGFQIIHASRESMWGLPVATLLASPEKTSNHQGHK